MRGKDAEVRKTLGSVRDHRAFTVCFAVWTMFGVTGIPIRAQLDLDSTQLGLLTATPVLTGALFRLSLGIWTDRFGGRIIMLILLVGCAVPLWISSYATALWQFLLLGLALGLVGASFSVGTPYVARFFPKESRERPARGAEVGSRGMEDRRGCRRKRRARRSAGGHRLPLAARRRAGWALESRRQGRRDRRRGTIS